MLLMCTVLTMPKATESNVKELSKLMNQLSDKMTEINDSLMGELSEVKRGIDLLKSSFEDVKTLVTSLTTELCTLKGAVSELGNENKELKRSSHQKNKVINLKQYSRRSNVEIKGAPFCTREDIVKIVVALAQKV